MRGELEGAPPVGTPDELLDRAGQLLVQRVDLRFPRFAGRLPSSHVAATSCRPIGSRLALVHQVRQALPVTVATPAGRDVRSERERLTL